MSKHYRDGSMPAVLRNTQLWSSIELDPYRSKVVWLWVEKVRTSTYIQMWVRGAIPFPPEAFFPF